MAIQLYVKHRTYISLTTLANKALRGKHLFNIYSKLRFSDNKFLFVTEKEALPIPTMHQCVLNEKLDPYLALFYLHTIPTVQLDQSFKSLFHNSKTYRSVYHHTFRYEIQLLEAKVI